MQWPEFISNFNAFWTKRNDIYEQWTQRNRPITSAQALPPVAIPRRLSTTIATPLRPAINPVGGTADDSAAVRVLEAELVEISERLRQTRYQLDEERQKRHMIRDDLDEARRQVEDERDRHRDVTKRVVVLEEDKMTHEIQVSRLREQIEQNVSLKESLQLDLDRSRMQLFHAKEKYETALGSAVADNEALRKKLEVLMLELQETKANGGGNRRDLAELEAQNTVLRQVIEKYRKALPNSRFADTADAVSSAAFDAPKLATQAQFLNALMEALDKAKFLNKQMQNSAGWSAQSWQDLCAGWRETVCELCDLFATAHRIEGQTS